MLNQPQNSAFNWDALNLPEEYRKEVARLLEVEEKLKLAHALGCAIIAYMNSPVYADSQGECLALAFFEATQYKA